MPKKSAPRTTDEKLRGLVNLKIESRGFYTQNELSDMLGISERTIRRYKNQKGYSLSPKTIQRARESINREDRKVKRMLDSGSAIAIRTRIVRGKRRRRPVLVKDRTMKMPPSRVLQLPVVYTSKSGESQTIKINVEGWTTEQKIDYLFQAHVTGRFSSWHAKVDLRKYLEQKLVDEYGSLEDAPAEALAGTLQPHYIMIGPFELGRIMDNLAVVGEKLRYYDDAGRVIVEIHVVENLKRKKKK